MVKCSSIKTILAKQIEKIYRETVSELMTKTGKSRSVVIKRIGSLDDIVDGICFAIEMTTETWHKPEIWLDENGVLKRDVVVEHIVEQYDEYEERMQAKAEFDVEARCNRG